MLVPFGYGFLGLATLASSILNGALQARLSLRILLIKTFVIGAPLLALGSLFGTRGLFVGISLGHLVGGLYALWALRTALRNVGAEQQSEQLGQLAWAIK